MPPEPGQTAPDFALDSTAGPLSLRQLLAQGPVVLAFYVEDDTPICNTELAAFQDDYPNLKELGAQVVGISVDGLESHRRFVEKAGGFPFPLASDPDLVATRLYGVASEDGKRSRRAVFVVGQDGRVLHAQPWYQPGNVEQYLAVYRALGVEV